MWTGKRIIITGSSGFVGANLVKALLESGASVKGYDIYKNSPSLRALGIESIPCRHTDINSEVLDSYIAEDKPDVVYNLAGLSHISDCQRCPLDAFRVNGLGTINVLEAVRVASPDAIVISSSSNHAYIGGNPNATLIGTPRKEGGGYGLSEDCPLQATDAYGASKAMADHAVKVYRESYGLRAAAVRHVNSYGPADPHDTHLVTGAILSCLKGERPVIKSDGTPLKAYLHVDDVVRAYLTVAEHVDELPGHAVNVTDAGCEAPVVAIVRTVMECAGMAGGPEVLKQDMSQSGYQERLDPALIHSLGWRAKYSLNTGIAHTYEWYRQHGGMAWRDS